MSLLFFFRMGLFFTCYFSGIRLTEHMLTFCTHYKTHVVTYCVVKYLPQRETAFLDTNLLYN